MLKSKIKELVEDSFRGLYDKGDYQGIFDRGEMTGLKQLSKTLNSGKFAGIPMGTKGKWVNYMVQVTADRIKKTKGTTRSKEELKQMLNVLKTLRSIIQGENIERRYAKKRDQRGLLQGSFHAIDKKIDDYETLFHIVKEHPELRANKLGSSRQHMEIVFKKAIEEMDDAVKTLNPEWLQREEEKIRDRELIQAVKDEAREVADAEDKLQDKASRDRMNAYIEKMMADKEKLAKLRDKLPTADISGASKSAAQKRREYLEKKAEKMFAKIRKQGGDVSETKNRSRYIHIAVESMSHEEIAEAFKWLRDNYDNDFSNE